MSFNNIDHMIFRFLKVIWSIHLYKSPGDYNIGEIVQCIMKKNNECDETVLVLYEWCDAFMIFAVLLEYNNIVKLINWQ